MDRRVIYIGMIVGMIIVLVTRAMEHRHKPAAVLTCGTDSGRENGRAMDDPHGTSESSAQVGHGDGKTRRSPGGRPRVTQ